MSGEVSISGFATAECKARTVEDLRALVAWLNKYNIPNDAGLDWGYGAVYVDLTGDHAVPAEMIECGDHVPPSKAYDIIISTHNHPDEKKEPAKFDWPAWDRYADERRPE